MTVGQLRDMLKDEPDDRQVWVFGGDGDSRIEPLRMMQIQRQFVTVPTSSGKPHTEKLDTIIVLQS